MYSTVVIEYNQFVLSLSSQMIFHGLVCQLLLLVIILLSLFSGVFFQQPPSPYALHRSQSVYHAYHILVRVILKAKTFC